MMLRVLILGYGPMGLALTRGVNQCPHLAEIAGVFPWSCHPRLGRVFNEQAEMRFRQYLYANGIPLLQAPSVNHYQFIQLLENLKVDIVLVGSWGEILQPHLFKIPHVRFVNCHPSLLPFHRGPNPYIGAIMAGESQSGITFHLMDEGIDTGPILLQRPLPILPSDTGGSLRERCSELAELAIPELLRLLQQDPPPTQRQAKGSYDRISSELVWVDWQASPTAIRDKVRALNPWMNSKARLNQMTLLFDAVALIPSENSINPLPGRPGVILSNQNQGLRVSTIDPDVDLLIQQYRLQGLPGLLNPLWKRLFVRQGHCFLPGHTHKRLDAI